MSVNSISALKLSATVPRILNKKRISLLDGFSVSAVAVYMYLYLMSIFCDILFSPIFLKVKSVKTAQMFFEDYVAPSKSAI